MIQTANATPATAPPAAGPLHLNVVTICRVSRARTWTGPEEQEEFEYIRSPVISAASSLASHRAFSPSHRSFSTKELFEAQADIVTAQAQVQGLHSALKRVSNAGSAQALRKLRPACPASLAVACGGRQHAAFDADAAVAAGA